MKDSKGSPLYYKLKAQRTELHLKTFEHALCLEKLNKAQKESELMDVQMQVTLLEADVRHFQEELKEEKSERDHEHNNLKRTIDDLKDENDRNEREVKKARTKYKTSEKECEELRSQLATLIEERKAFKMELEEVRDSLQSQANRVQAKLNLLDSH